MEIPKYLFIVVLYNSLLTAQGVDRTITAVLTETFVYSPAYEYGFDYAANTSFDYYISTSYPGHNISLTVNNCEIESDKNGACLYDVLYIYDGPTNASSLLVTFCCPNPSGPTWYSSTNEMYMHFTSDATNNYAGFNISAVSFGPTTTTSTTSTTTTSTPATTTTTTTTAATTTAAPTTVAPTVAPTTAASSAGASNNAGGGGAGDSSLYIIIGCVVGGVLLLIIIILAICYFMKKSKSSRSTSPDSTHKRFLWSRQTTAVKPFDNSDVPPGTVTQTNIFDLSLPDGRANLLPPLDSKMGGAHPVVSPAGEKII